MSTTRRVDGATETVVISARARPAFRKRLEAVQLERGDRWLSDTVLALLEQGVREHEHDRAA